MPTFRYEKEIRIANDKDVFLKIEFPDSGTHGEHSVDLPGSAKDFDCSGECKRLLGKGLFLKTERTLVISEVLNSMDIEIVPNVNANYYINEELVVVHSNPKSVTKTPRVIIKLFFI